MSKKDSQVYIEDILTAIKKIQTYCRGIDYLDFCQDEKLIDAVVRNLEIIGEAAKNIPPFKRKLYRNVPWQDIIDMRNKMIHEYSGVNLEIVWKTIEDDLPELKKELG